MGWTISRRLIHSVVFSYSKSSGQVNVMMKLKNRFLSFIGMGTILILGMGCDEDPSQKYPNNQMNEINPIKVNTLWSTEGTSQSGSWCSSSLCVNKFKNGST